MHESVHQQLFGGAGRSTPTAQKLSAAQKPIHGQAQNVCLLSVADPQDWGTPVEQKGLGVAILWLWAPQSLWLSGG